MKKLKYLSKLKSRNKHYFTSTADEKTKWVPLSVDRQLTRWLGGGENEIRRLRDLSDIHRAVMARPDELRNMGAIDTVTLNFEQQGNGSIGSRYTVDLKYTNLDSAIGSVCFSAKEKASQVVT